MSHSLTPLVGLSAITVKVLHTAHRNQGIFLDQSNRSLIKRLESHQFLTSDGPAYILTDSGTEWLRQAGLLD